MSRRFSFSGLDPIFADRERRARIEDVEVLTSDQTGHCELLAPRREHVLWRRSKSSKLLSKLFTNNLHLNTFHPVRESPTGSGCSSTLS